ncbi:protein lin-52 homolog [Mya arenaria]|uniref:protein lin-52 homolog n=1 Tax=Mya arenaria TaxID=6604 RepID=UPI0022DFCB78|nr:protein lin-52 homolog [Mya arenaria]XP_052767398.1 protein lin-52 homolog [Mya arenaria]
MAESSKRKKANTGDSNWMQYPDGDQLLSFEKLDRASPDLWPEKIPGVSEFAAERMLEHDGNPPKWMADLENEDINLLQEFGSLTTSQLMEKVKGLQNLAYQLGLDEAREMTRGKYLNVLEKQNK